MSRKVDFGNNCDITFGSIRYYFFRLLLGIETTASLLWTGNAIDLVELIYGIDEMGCINNGNMPLKQLAPILYKIFGIESKDCYRFYTDIKRRKNESRTYFLDKMQEKLNERMLRDEELERMRR